MKRSAVLTVATVCAVALIFAAREARSQKGDEARSATILHIMKGIQKPNLTKLTTASKSAPADDKGWEDAEMCAALLNETSFILVEAGRAKDDVWTKACADLRAASAAAAAAAKAKNLDGIKAEIPKIAATCKACHDVHNQ